MLTDYHRRLSKVVSSAGWNRNPTDLAFSLMEKLFAVNLPTLQKYATCITSNAAAEIEGDAPLDTPPAAQIVGRPL